METLSFEWNEEKNERNKSKHNVSFEEAATAFYDENALLIPDVEHSDDEERFVLLGMSEKNKSARRLPLPERKRNGYKNNLCANSHEDRNGNI